MKKFMMAAAISATVLTANAQDSYKFAAGDNNFEFASAPFSGSPLAIPQIKYRRFISETMAVRVGLNLTMNSKTTAQDAPSTVTADKIVELNKVESTFGWELAPGIEKHFAGTERLSPYIGAELRVAGSSKTTKDERLEANDKIETTTTKNDKKGGFVGFGLNLVAGADFYFAKKLYLGAEFAYGFGFTSYSESSIEDTEATKQPEPVRQGSDFGFGSNLGSANGRLKLGFLF